MYLFINIVFYCVIMDDFFCKIKYVLDYKWRVDMYRLYGILVWVDLDVKKIILWCYFLFSVFIV